ncbi:tetratricopeptide repeat protein [Actinokineospora auranticolor]|uniref:ATP-binding protein n=1 Tax=Actinokineospora auranticolor TaxID=155976 RepID=UPI0015E415F8|nr:tetratricopeptide repeat protein [Actinokineospora auranticolor]
MVTGHAGAVLQVGSVVRAREVNVWSGARIPVPRQLPPDTPAFTGRDWELRTLDSALADGTRLCVVTGPPGVGKTALAVRWAHRVEHRYPDGQLVVNLRGFDRDGRPLPPASALDDFLLALDVPPGRIPVDLDAKAGLFRSLVAERRVLVLLDNARDSAQVRPLLPGAPGCAVVVTGRNVLSGLLTEDGAALVRVRPLTRAGGARMLAAAVPGADSDTALSRLVDLCAGLPLALRIVSQRLVSDPHTALADLADELGNSRTRLAGFEVDEESVAIRAVFSWSYDILPPDAARLFRAAGRHPGPHFSLDTAAAYADLPLPRARRAMATLTAAHLVETTGRDRHQFHDLLRCYAEDRAATEAPARRRASVRRAVTGYLAAAEAASRFVRPVRPPLSTEPGREFSDYDDAVAWLDGERPNFLPVVRMAAREGLPELGWRLAGALWPYFDLRKPWEEWTALLRVGLACALTAGDRFGEGLMRHDLAFGFRHRGEPAEAVVELEHALAAFRAVDGTWGIGSCLNWLGDLRRALRQFEPALESCERALGEWRLAGDLVGETWALRNLGLIYRDLGDDERALAAFARARELFEQRSDSRGLASVLRNEGIILRRTGELARSRETLERALAIHRARNDEWNEACSLERLGETRYATGDTDAAVAAWRRALEIFEKFHDHRATRVRLLLSGQ